MRDHMSEAELIFTALAESSTHQIAEGKEATGFSENTQAARTAVMSLKRPAGNLRKKQARKWLRTRIICQVNEIIKTPRYHDMLASFVSQCEKSP